MQVANTLNNQIRILFNPLVENFKLFDFLMVKSNADKYLAQIIEIYDDKFDASQNVAKLKLFYKISQDNEVLPYDNFTPNKECEIVKIKQQEVEDFVNSQKETFAFGKNVKNAAPLNLQYEFFNNNAVIMSDKIEDANIVVATLAKKLSVKKHSVIIDSTGSLELDGAKKVKAIKDFKIPLNYETIDFVFDKLLEDASLEFQSIAGEIINEIKKFAAAQENQFIPFSAFIKVLGEQYKATPYPELKLLGVKLKKCQMDLIFARTKKDKQNLFNEIKKNDISIIDLSNISAMWQKPVFEYIAQSIEDEIYLFSRINEENADVDIINKIYCAKKNISFIPSVSYNYKKLPSIMQFCKNYVLLSSLYQRNDFLNANFALNNLIAQNCLIFGENTDNFIYLAKDFGIVNEEQKKIYRKIALSLLDSEEVKQQGEENQTDSEKLLKELNDFNSGRNEQPKEKEEEEQKQETTQGLEDDFQNLADYKDQKSEIKEEIEKIRNAAPSQDAQFRFIEETTAKEEEALEVSQEVELETQDVQQEAEIIQDSQEEENEVLILQEEEPKTQNSIEQVPVLEIDGDVDDSPIQVQDEEEAEEETPAARENSPKQGEDYNLSDDELDFFQIAKESSKEYESTLENKVLVDNVEYKTQNDETDNIKKNELQPDDNQELLLDGFGDEEINLDDVAQTSLDDSFSEIINSKNNQNPSNIEGTELTADILEQPVQQKENLPIFKEEIPGDEPMHSYQTGQFVVHNKYGRGQIIKIVRYEQRQLLQIEFEQAGKKLLDPKIANIKPEQLYS